MMLQFCSKFFIVNLIQWQRQQCLSGNVFLQLSRHCFPHQGFHGNLFHIKKLRILRCCHQYPVQIRPGCSQHRIWDLSALFQTLPFAQLFGQEAVCSCHDQFFFRSGHGHIENTQLFSQIIQIHLPLHDIFLQRRILGPLLQIQVICPDAQIHIDQQPPTDILFIEFFPHSC